MDDRQRQRVKKRAATPRRPARDPAGLELYRIRWELDDISAFVQMFRTRHRRTADAEHTWLGMNNTLVRTTS